MNLTQEKVTAESCYSLVPVVADFIQKRVHPRFEELASQSLRETYLHGLHSRATAWLMTLRKLDEPVNFQAILSGVRSLLETAVDMVLLSYDKTDASAFRMRQWEVSAKLKSAKAIVSYFKTRARAPVPDEYQPQVEFIEREEASVEMIRAGLWPYTGPDPKRQGTGSHPDRWTGKNLSTDVLAADRLHGGEIKKILGTSIEEFYAIEYRRLNWSVHGSGLAGVWNLPPEAFYAVCGLAFVWCVRLAMICSLIVITEFKDSGMTENLPALEEEARRLCAVLAG